MDASGNFIVAWQMGNGVYARRYNADGVPLTSGFRVSPITGAFQGDPSVAMDAAGEFVIAWTSYDQDGSGNGIYAKRYNAAGKELTPPAGATRAVGNEFRVNATTANDQESPSVAIGAGGSFVVAWQSFAQDGSGYGAYARPYNAVGAPLTGELQVNATTANDQESPSVAMDAGGNFVVAWEGDRVDALGRNVFARQYNAAGVPLTGERQVNATTAQEEDYPSAAMDAGGNFVVAWTSYGSVPGVFARRYGPNEAPTSLGIAPVNVLANAQPTVIDLTSSFADPNEPSSALAYNVVGDTNSALFSSTSTDASGKLMLNYAPNQSGQATLTIRATDSGGLFVESSFTVTVRSGPPVLSAVTINDGSPQRSQVKSLTFAFDRIVTLAAGAVTLRLLNAGGSGANDNSPPTDATAALGSPNTPDGGKTWIYPIAAGSPFTQTSGGNPTGSLVDGIYTLSVDPAKVTSGGVPMTAAPQPLTFHRLFGDVNGDAAVNPLDYAKFRNAFGKTAGAAGYDAAFDFDPDGAVNALDYNQFRNRFGKGLAY